MKSSLAALCRHRRALSFGLSLFVAAFAAAQTVPIWTETTPTALLAGSSPVGLAHGNGVFVVTGYTGVAGSFSLVSPDGANWTRHAFPETGTLVGNVRFVNGRFWTVGYSGPRSVVYSSVNGSAWTIVQTLTGASPIFSLVDLAASGGTFLALLDDGLIGSTDNGTTWSVLPRPTATSGGLRPTGIAVLNGIWVVSYASFGASGTKMFRSTDGQTWTPIASRTFGGGYTPVFAFNGQFLNYEFGTTNAQAWVSNDGLVWSQAGPGNNSVASRGNGATAIGPGGYRVANGGTTDYRVATTRDNVTFTNIGLLPFAQNIRFFAIGDTAIVGMDNVTAIRIAVGPAPAVAPVAPAISTQPTAQTVAAGGGVTFSVTATGAPLNYEWRFNNTPIAGATGASYAIAAVSAAHAGSYAVRVFNDAGSVTSNAATLIVTAAPPAVASRLINLSILTSLSGAGDAFTLGYVVGGAGTSGAKPLLIRAAGPSLSQFGVPGPLADPRLESFAGQAKSGENDNWGGTAAITAAITAVSAFPFTGATSLDAAVAASVAAGDNSVKVSPVGNLSGAVIAEIYDATPAANFTAATPRLINVSVLKNIGASLTAGFVIGGGTASRTVLIRAVGPTLGAAPFNVPGVVADPQLVLFSGQTQIGANDNWGGAAVLAAAMAQVTFALPASSRDAALVTSLAPGSYTVQVSGVGGATGVALVEVYELP